MNALVADTHAVIWYFFASPRLRTAARDAMEATIAKGDSIVVATITLVEIVYLTEKGRIAGATFERLIQELSDPSSPFVSASLDLNVCDAMRLVPRALIPDMPDRIIAATALHLGRLLVTADQKIRASGVVATVW